jgi:hypothetical protein
MSFSAAGSTGGASTIAASQRNAPALMIEDAVVRGYADSAIASHGVTRGCLEEAWGNDLVVSGRQTADFA